jgi:enterochelin esterase-like enzyme
MRLEIFALALMLAACSPIAAARTLTPELTTLTVTASPNAAGTTPTIASTPTAAPATPRTTPAKPAPVTSTLQPCPETKGRSIVLYLHSATLGRSVAWSLYVPPCYNDDPARVYPVLYLLPGLYADHTQWPDLNVASEADTLIAKHAIAPLVVVMPDGGYGADDDYGKFFLRDLIPQVEQTVRVSRERSDRAIGGVSWGGYWALYLALTHPDLFGEVGGNSPSINDRLTAALGLAAGAKERSTLRIYLDVGRGDPVAPDVAAFAAAVKAAHLTSTYHLNAGGHDRPYWSAHIAEYLVFYAADWRK